MNRLDQWLLKRICKKLVKQGPSHQYRIAQYYKIMADAARREFTEDNEPTLKAFLDECYEGALEEDDMDWGQSYDLLRKEYLEKKRKEKLHDRFGT